MLDNQAHVNNRENEKNWLWKYNCKWIHPCGSILFTTHVQPKILFTTHVQPKSYRSSDTKTNYQAWTDRFSKDISAEGISPIIPVRFVIPPQIPNNFRIGTEKQILDNQKVQTKN